MPGMFSVLFSTLEFANWCRNFCFVFRRTEGEGWAYFLCAWKYWWTLCTTGVCSLVLCAFLFVTLTWSCSLAFVHCNNDGNELPETITEVRRPELASFPRIVITDLCTCIQIQSRLFDIMSHIATPAESASESKIVKTSFPDHETGSLEAKIDELDAKLPKLTKFILPVCLPV